MRTSPHRLRVTAPRLQLTVAPGGRGELPTQRPPSCFFFAHYRLSETTPVTSDGASNALQAWDMLHGNWLLRGWTLTDVSFYTTELPEYILVESLRGLGPWDVHTAAALTYTLLVVLAGLLAKGTKTGLEGLVRVLIAAGIMIAPQVGHGVFILLLAPDHTGTGVPVLATWLVLDRARRRRWVPPLICLMLTWALAGAINCAADRRRATRPSRGRARLPGRHRAPRPGSGIAGSSSR